MKKIGLLMMSLAFSFAANASTTKLQCATKNTKRGGVRINMLEGSTLKGNLIFGTTISGTMYELHEVRGNVYQGIIKSDKARKYYLRLIVSNTPADNGYIRGHAAQLDARYPNLNNANQMADISTKDSDEFVCGKQIRSYRD